MYFQNLIKSYIESGPRIWEIDGSLTPIEDTQDQFWKCVSFLSNLRSKTPIGLQLGFGSRYLVSLLACLYSGRTFLPLRMSWPQARLRQILENFEIETLIDENKFNQIVATFDAQPNYPETLDLPAYVICTSGTTGSPKGVISSRTSLQHFYEWMRQSFHFQAKDRLLFLTDFTFDISHVDIALLLQNLLGVRFSNYANSQNLFELAAEIEEFEPQIINTVPNTLTMLCEPTIRERAELSSLKAVFSGGARFSLGLYNEVFKTFSKAQIYNFYGPTEATIYSHIASLKGDVSKEVHNGNVTIGLPIGEMKGPILGNLHKPIKEPYRTGELYLGGPQIMEGYYKNPEKTCEVIRIQADRKYYATGDLAYFDESGQTYIVGRTDDTLKRRGFRVNLLDIDSYILTIDGISNCKTIGYPDPKAENLLVCFVVGKIDEKELIDQLKLILPSHQMPDRIFFIDQLPTNNSGKVCGRTLADRFRNRTTSSASHLEKDFHI